MMLRIISVAACAALLAGPALAQADEQDGQLDLESIDALLGGETVTEPVANPDAAAVAVPETADGDEVVDPDGAEEDAISSEDPPTEPTDLDRAYALYGQCVADAGVDLEATDFAIPDVGREAVLRCAGARAAYVNAFYFSLIPRYPGLGEQDVRATAERLVSSTDEFLITKAGEDAARARRTRPATEEAVSE